jgi:predicted acyl esterase
MQQRDDAVSRTQEWVVLTGGDRLAVSLYLPLLNDRPGARVPCLLEALPYRKDDVTAAYRPEYVRFAREYGYAVARVDLRGTGSSTGIMPGEYDATEQADLREVIAWLAGREWCTGAVGMFGTSWSGFNALQLAAERPPELRAVVASYATDDRWTDDVHYSGGALRLLDLVDYPLYMVAMNGLPPVPALFGEGWREEWRRRVEGTPAWLLEWLEHRTDGPFWRHGSVRAGPGHGTAGYDRIGCPTMLVTGWADGYRNITYRMAAALLATGTPVKVVAGPWSHASPATAVPGPNVDHVPLMARWWDRWLRGEPNGVDAEPPVTVFVRGYRAPRPDLEEWAGRWEAHDAATLAAAADVVLPFTDAQVSGAVVDRGTARYTPVPDVGRTAWNSCAAALPWGQPSDQTPDDARSLCLEWRVPDGTVVLGHPRVRLRLRPSAATGAVSAKLSLVPRDGPRPSMLATRGLLNLAYRGGDGSRPEPCVPGEWVDVEVELEATAFETGGPGHAGGVVRLALACADWPNTVSIPGGWSEVDLAASALVLPASAGTPHPAPGLPPPPGAEPDGGPGPDDAEHVTWRQGEDVLRRATWAEVDHGSSYGGGHGVRCTERYTGRVELDLTDGVQRASGTATFALAWPGGVAATSEARLDVTVDAETIDVRVALDVHEAEAPFATRRWHSRIPRYPT